MKKIYVGNIPQSMNAASFEDLFKHYRTVSAVELVTNPVSGLACGCGFVTFDSNKEAFGALTAIDGVIAQGQALVVREVFSGRLALS